MKRLIRGIAAVVTLGAIGTATTPAGASQPEWGDCGPGAPTEYWVDDSDWRGVASGQDPDIGLWHTRHYQRTGRLLLVMTKYHGPGDFTQSFVTCEEEIPNPEPPEHLLPKPAPAPPAGSGGGGGGEGGGVAIGGSVIWVPAPIYTGSVSVGEPETVAIQVQ